tara:strand:- start:218 stop:808 length:591 start_codon:yes stop_codon:yes gene_type:complete
MRNNLINKGFSLVEMIIVVGIISTISGLTLPTFLNWVRSEKVNSYTRELKEYLRIVRLEARRWGTSCDIKINEIDHNGISSQKSAFGFDIICDNENSTISSLIPSLNNSIFQIVNTNFKITPNGRLSSNKPVVIVMGSQFFNSGSKILNCLLIQTPTGHIIKGKYQEKDWIDRKIAVSQIDKNNKINSTNCKTSFN